MKEKIQRLIRDKLIRDYPMISDWTVCDLASTIVDVIKLGYPSRFDFDGDLLTVRDSSLNEFTIYRERQTDIMGEFLDYDLCAVIELKKETWGE